MTTAEKEGCRRFRCIRDHVDEKDHDLATETEGGAIILTVLDLPFTDTDGTAVMCGILHGKTAIVEIVHR